MLLRRGRYLEFNRESGVWVWIGLGAIWLSSYPILHAVLYDRGVKFGLAGGRFESVMVSGTWIGKTSEGWALVHGSPLCVSARSPPPPTTAPPLIAFKYDHHPPEGSEEARLVAILKQPKEWV